MGGANHPSNEYPNDYPNDYPTLFLKRNVHISDRSFTPTFTLSEHLAAIAI